MTYRLALLGAGSTGTLHARVIAQSERATLATVIEPLTDVGRALAERYRARWEPELQSLDDIDAVVVAAPTEAHHELAMRVIELGKPLLVEKPLADDLDRAEAVVAAARAAGVPLMCGLVERHNPAVLTARALLREPIHLTAVRHGPYAPRIRTGVAWDLLVHDVDLAIQLFGGGAPHRTRASAGHVHPHSVPGAEDTIDAVLSFDTGVATVSASRIGQRKVRSLTVAELDRLVEVDLVRRDVTIYRHVTHDRHVTPEQLSEAAPAYRAQTVIELPELVTVREPLAAQLDHFLDILDGTADADTERDSILPAHRVVAEAIAQTRA